MSWLIGIICVVIVISLWRIFLPLGILAAISIAGFILYENHESDKRKKVKIIETQQLRDRIASSQRNATSEGKEWIIYVESDPASDYKIARTASITSNDGLCNLTVQKRLNGTELTGLKCSGIKISEFDDIYVKFDTQESSKRMDLKGYSDSEDVYIPSYSYQSEYSGRLGYDAFISGLVTNNSVAIKVPSVGSFWTRFTLKGSSVAINQLGRKMPSEDKPK